jgi:hypothetical protein
MEYEIEDEDVLFDPSANPSQKPKDRQSARNQPPVHPRDSLIERVTRQMGELIPEEEDLAA